MFALVDLFAYARPLTRAPPPPAVLLIRRGSHHKTADDTKAAADDDAPNNSNYAIMPPKVKPPTKKPTKRESAFSVKAEGPLTVSYYTDGVYNYTDVAFHVNRMMQKSEYQV
jgi:hypothetical protein